MNRFHRFFLSLLLVFGLLLLGVSNTSFGQVTLIGWDFNDSNTTADAGGISSNSGKQLTKDVRIPSAPISYATESVSTI